MNLALVQQQQINVPETSWVGHTTMAGFGIILMVVSVLCIKGNKRKQPMGPWGPMFGSLMDRAVAQPTKRMAAKWGGGDEGLDWKSLMTFFIGMWAMTSILSSSPGTVVNLADFFQSLMMKLSGWPILEDVGAGGVCLLLFFFAMRNKDDDKADLMYGSICGFVFPLGGGIYSEITLQIGHWIPQVMSMG
ncbi:hypothetical protein [Streptomyces cucumeris]|uniref:hypothetical protein n=1 Tax=Streptomyces cucumeris TaxID=2962890 RepID=UPI0020C885F6|nr:hypothetical protein [Streptomyces sp. NEAU-Y11]MCP9209685.1 hypothetical protein [Streptomyces sp. NEAU-Y11]